MRISDWSSDVCSSDLRPAASEPVRLIGLIALCRLEFLFQMLGEFVGDARDKAIVNQVLRLQTCGIAFADKRMLANLRVHQRLREARLVALIVTEAALAPPADHDVQVTRLTESDRHLHSERHAHPTHP